MDRPARSPGAPTLASNRRHRGRCPRSLCRPCCLLCSLAEELRTMQSADTVATVYHRASGAPRSNGFLYGGHDLASEDLDLPLVLPGGPEYESVHTVFQGEPRERLDPPRWRAFEGTFVYGADAARDVVRPTDLPWLPSCPFGAFVDPSDHLREPPRRRVA